MLSTPALYCLAILSVAGCIASAGLLLWSTYQQGKSHVQKESKEESPSDFTKQDDDDDNDIKPSDSTNNRFRQLQRQLNNNMQWVYVGGTILLLLSIAAILLVWETVQDVEIFEMTLGVVRGGYLFILFVTILVRHYQQKTVTTGLSSSSTSLSSNWMDIMASQYQTLRSIGIFHLYVLCAAGSFYSIATLLGDNPAFDASSYYHGPAPILTYEGGNVNYNNVARTATITVGYGGDWACPTSSTSDNDDDNNQQQWCEQEVELSWCDIYDKTGYFATDTRSSLSPTWRLWEGEDLWASSFSCAMGMYGGNQDDDGDDNNEDGGDDDANPNNQQYLDSPFDSPYLINIFATCDGSCQLAIDSPVFRDKFYHVSSMKTLIVESLLASIIFLGMAFTMLSYQQRIQNDDSADVNKEESLQATAGVHLLPAQEKGVIT